MGVCWHHLPCKWATLIENDPVDGYAYLERWAGNELIREFDANVVVTGLCGYVFDGARSIAIITACHFSLRRTFNGQTQSSRSGTFRFDGEDVGLVDHTAFQTWAERFNFTGIASAASVDSERRSGNWDTIVHDIDFVGSFYDIEF